MNPARRSLKSDRRSGFTLVEIMIVVSIVMILSFLAMFVIGRIKQSAAHSLLQNNLRQLYQAKEYYFTETGDGGSVGVKALIAGGYLKPSIEDRLFGSGSMETKMGWHYGRRFVAGEPTYAYQGPQPTAANPPAIAEYYPGQPTSFAATFPTGTGQTPPPSQPGTQVTTTPQKPPTIVSPPVVTPQPIVAPPTVVPPPVVIPPPVVTPPAVVTPPVVTPTANGPQPVATQTPVVTQPNPQIANQPPQPTQSPNSGSSTSSSSQPNPAVNQAHSPGNSAFGHSQGNGQGQGNHGQGNSHGNAPNKP